MIECVSCAAREGEAPFPQSKRRGVPWVCLECSGDFTAAEVREKIARPVLLTRRAWRARQRVRAASPQRDLLDTTGV